MKKMRQIFLTNADDVNPSSCNLRIRENQRTAYRGRSLPFTVLCYIVFSETVHMIPEKLLVEFARLRRYKSLKQRPTFG